jgi:hypothetical protein
MRWIILTGIVAGVLMCAVVTFACLNMSDGD